MNNKSFLTGILVGIVLTLILLATLICLDKKYGLVTDTQTVENNSVDSFYVDTIMTPVINMLDEEFTIEMMKGVQGDFTLEQVDSMQKSWAILDSIESNSQ